MRRWRKNGLRGKRRRRREEGREKVENNVEKVRKRGRGGDGRRTEVWWRMRKWRRIEGEGRGRGRR